MFSNKNNSEVETIIGPSVFLKGKLKSDSNVKVQGKISGEIKTKGDVFINEEAQIKATISAKNIIISGEVVGDIEAFGEITITETGKVVGNINSAALIIKMGAIFIGKSSMMLEPKEVKTKKEKKEGKNVVDLEPEPELES